MIHPQPTTVLLLLVEPEQSGRGRPGSATLGLLARIFARWRDRRFKDVTETSAAGADPSARVR